MRPLLDLSCYNGMKCNCITYRYIPQRQFLAVLPFTHPTSFGAGHYKSNCTGLLGSHPDLMGEA